MLKTRLAIPLLAVVPLLAACGGSITLQVTDEGGDVVDDLEVQFLPFDRDSLFSAMAARSADPEPQVPADLQAANDSVQALEAVWTTAEEEWGTVREELRQLSERLRGLDPRGREYLELFDQFNDLEARERSLNRQRQEAFNTFTALQQSTQTRLDSIRAVIQSWEDVAFADYADEESALLAALGREVVYDTTDAQGVVSRGLPGGTWWVHTRVRIPGGELYWNLPTEVGGDTLRLGPANAQRRLAF